MVRNPRTPQIAAATVAAMWEASQEGLPRLDEGARVNSGVVDDFADTGL